MSHPVQTLLRTEKKKEKTKTQTKKSQIKSTSPTLQRIAPWMNRRERYAKEPSLCCYLSATHHHMICIICIVCKLCDPPIDHLNRAGFAKRGKNGACANVLQHRSSMRISSRICAGSSCPRTGPSPLLSGPSLRDPLLPLPNCSAFFLQQSREILSSPSFAYRTLPKGAP